MYCKINSVALMLVVCPLFNMFAMNTESDAFKWELEFAEKYGASAGMQSSLGDRYMDGNGVEKNPAKALEWHLKAAIGGNIRSQIIVSTFYADGVGTEKNPIEAFEWMLKAANGGFHVAQRKVGDFYAKGFGVEQDVMQALEWYIKSIRNEDPISAYAIGELYRDEIGDPWKAFSWFLKAAERDYYKARQEVALCYENGIGVEKNHENAISWSYPRSVEFDFELFDRLETNNEYLKMQIEEAHAMGLGVYDEKQGL
ncbi:MAG: tetratricopeptide repeat protein [Candidatus Babeliales bacterium]